jgi:hypothetical protein
MVGQSGSRALFTAALIITSFTGVAFSFSQEAPQKSQGSASGASALAAEAPFLSENDTAMNRMMDGMSVKPTGDANRDFVEMMIPHHQGAIDMAQAYLRYGTNEQLKRIAQEIIVDQLQEIAAMRLALGDPLPASTASPTQVAPQESSSDPMPGMSVAPTMDPNMKMGN